MLSAFSYSVLLFKVFGNANAIKKYRKICVFFIALLQPIQSLFTEVVLLLHQRPRFLPQSKYNLRQPLRPGSQKLSCNRGGPKDQPNIPGQMGCVCSKGIISLFRLSASELFVFSGFIYVLDTQRSMLCQQFPL